MNYSQMKEFSDMQNGITIKYIYSACIVTKTKDVTILHDPWFTEGIYDGAWFHYPKIENPFTSIGEVDYIFVSHIHPDHYDSSFIKQYFDRFGVKKIIIADHERNHLYKKMCIDGFAPIVLKDDLIIGNTSIKIVPHITGSTSDIDSAIIIKLFHNDNNHCVVNVNDIVFDDAMIAKIKDVAGNIDILLCGFTGAGPYPQTYFDLNDPQLLIESQKKKISFFERYKKLTSKLNAKVNIPFAGKYILGGKLSQLNLFRGVADPIEVLDFDQKAVVLQDNGGEINTESMATAQTRTYAYRKEDIDAVIRSLEDKKMDYERLFCKEELVQLPIKRLLHSASRNALSMSELDYDYYYCINLSDGEWAIINANKNSKSPLKFVNNNYQLPIPRSEILIDQGYLFGLLTNIYHWNTAEVGSQFYTKRIPNTYDTKALSFLNFLSV